MSPVLTEVGRSGTVGHYVVNYTQKNGQELQLLKLDSQLHCVMAGEYDPGSHH
eukprot:m.30856 g.30856  ORF g.30856 m.30856 type:complete len:53 (+) comp8251_c0_seq1:53-211(+)